MHPVTSPTGSDQMGHKTKVSRPNLLAGAEFLPLWPKLEFRGVECLPPPPPSDVPSLERIHTWEQMGSHWRRRACPRGSRAKPKPIGGSCPGSSRLDQVVLKGLGHKVLTFRCSDRSAEVRLRTLDVNAFLQLRRV